MHDLKVKNSRPRTLHNRVDLIIAVFLTMAIVAVYFQVHQHEFVVYDDRVYVTDNPFVRDGLSARGVNWAFDFTEKNKTYWHPLTWLSHMVDVQLFGLNAGKHLVINLLLHLLNSILLFSLFKRMTGSTWPSALIAGLFALHPLNVESVAWVAARKNLLSSTFWFLTTFAYVHYTEKPGLGRYALILSIFSLGLLSKPMLVTLPCTLLLLDVWPLRRCMIFQGTDTDQPMVPLRRLLLEKVPMLILSAISVGISTFSLSNYGDLVAVESVSMPIRIANAVVSYVSYLGKLIFPLGLTCYYPFPSAVPHWRWVSALVFLIVITTMALRLFKRHPYFAVGWFWYLGTLFPVIGLVQAGLWPATADRFVYIPLIGIFIIVAWWTKGFANSWDSSRRWLSMTALSILVLLAALSHNQTGYWRNSITLFKHAIKVTDNNYLSHYALGFAYEQKGAKDNAIYHYRASLQINPNEVDAHFNLAVLLASEGQIDAAVRHYENVLRIEPHDAQARNNLGNIYFRQGDLDQAQKHYREAIRITPDYAKAHNNLGAVLIRRGKIPEAVHHFREALRIVPKDELTKRYLRLALAQLNQPKEKPKSTEVTP
jgi:tetratricopeptide (TPR) repeat protein